jgi:hypothetical protein
MTQWRHHTGKQFSAEGLEHSMYLVHVSFACYILIIKIMQISTLRRSRRWSCLMQNSAEPITVKLQLKFSVSGIS